MKASLQQQPMYCSRDHNYPSRYEGMLAHSFDRFYVVTKFMLPTIGDLKFTKLDFDYTCEYTRKEYAPNTESKRYMLELKAYCNKIRPFVT